MLNDKRVKHGYATRGNEHPLYKIYKGMRTRCYNKNRINYKYYGEKGITICNEWLMSPSLFIEWALENGWVSGLEIDRVDINGNYEPSNCRIVDKFVQAQNTSKIVCTNKTGFRGVSKSGNSFKAQISINNKKIHIGFFSTALEGGIAYDNFVKENKSSHTLNFT